MEGNILQETRNLESWIKNYWKVWASPALNVSLARQDGDIEDIKENPLIGFEKYVEGEGHYGRACDMSRIPPRFIHQTNRLVNVYNNLIAKDELNLNKLERVIDKAKKTIYRRW